jgi:3-isopropylmalate/(R)-2-methylmalate dehydratase small subunit
LTTLVSDPATNRLTIDVEHQCVSTSDGTRYAFDLPPRQKRMFIEGLDMIGMTLADSDAIRAFEAKHEAAHPWMKIDLPKQRKTQAA